MQLYVRDPVASVTRPVKQLVGLRPRRARSPAQTRRVTFRLDPSQLAFYDAAMRFVVEPGDFQVMIGASSADIRLDGSFAIDGAERELRRRPGRERWIGDEVVGL